MATSATTSTTNAIQALGVGSGVDTKTLAKNLVEAEAAPRRDAINKVIDKTEARISAYATINYAVKNLEAAFAALKDDSDYDSVTVRNGDTNAVEVIAGAGASAGTHAVKVVALAQSQRNASIEISDISTEDTATIPSSFYIALDTDGDGSIDANDTPVEISVSTRSPEGLVDAINSYTSSTGVTATLVDIDGDETSYKIILQGETGADNAFELWDDSAGTSTAVMDAIFPTSGTDYSLQSAQDAEVEIDGLTVYRSTNMVDDVISGITFNLLEATNVDINVGVARDIAPIKEKIQAIVTSYNDLQSILDSAADRESTVEGLGGALAGDSTERILRSTIRDLLLNTYTVSGSSYTRLSDLGVSIDRYGKLQIESEATLDDALVSSFDEVVTFLAGPDDGTDGMADTLSDELTDMTDTLGLIQTQSRSASEQLEDYEEQLAKLETRMEKLLENYTKQFAAMDALVGQTNSLRASVENSFKGMSYSRN